jgi:hypothetical protein
MDKNMKKDHREMGLLQVCDSLAFVPECGKPNFTRKG